jgi:hypothetical protein
VIAPGKEDALEAIDPGGVGIWQEQYPFGVYLKAADREPGTPSALSVKTTGRKNRQRLKAKAATARRAR